MPPRAWAKLTRILNAIEIDGQWPEALGKNLLALLGKPKGGERAITITHIFYAIWARARRAFRLDYEKVLQAFWDSAVSAPSGGALRAALTRRLCNEVAVERRQASLEVLCDIESLYDSISYPHMVVELLAQGFSPWLLRLIVGQ